MKVSLSWMDINYAEVTTKVHIQRQGNPCQTLDIIVHDDTVLDVSNPVNKQGFIDLLDEKMNAKPRLTALEMLIGRSSRLR